MLLYCDPTKRMADISEKETTGEGGVNGEDGNAGEGGEDGEGERVDGMTGCGGGG